MSCGVVCRRGSDLALLCLWLWCRPVASAPLGPLAWEPPYAMGVTLKEKKKKKSPTLRVLFFLFSFFSFLGLQLGHMEVPRFGVELELQPLAYTTPTTRPDTSPVCYLHYSSQQRRILNLLREARDRTHVLMDTSWVHYH